MRNFVDYDVEKFLFDLTKKEKDSTSPIIKNYIFYEEKIKLND